MDRTFLYRHRDLLALIHTAECAPSRLEQQTVDLKAALEERGAELEAGRDANRQLTRALNQRA
ncbi:hypothetical protein [Streptomyces neyagawaensis]|uniref:Uncharacterized protein n=1 Tax=Streptomyces neyagawaensis TaxID=42238 RepID=A0ABV3B9M0_9ACTN